MEPITVKSKINAPSNKVWDLWTDSKHIVKWDTAPEDWHTSKAENDLRVGGKFLSRMEAKDGSFGFDFGETYDEVVPHKRIVYTMGDGRNVVVDFNENQGRRKLSLSSMPRAKILLNSNATVGRTFWIILRNM